METATISMSEYISLRNRSLKLEALEAFGVDNWVGWDEAMDLYSELKGEL